MSTAATVGGALLRRAVNFRLGIVPAVHILPTTMSDVAGVWHASATRPGPGPQSAPAGGVGWTRDAAERAAIGEALERYAAAVADLSEPEGSHLSAGALGLDDFSLFTPAQRRAPGFPYADVFAGRCGAPRRGRSTTRPRRGTCRRCSWASVARTGTQLAMDCPRPRAWRRRPRRPWPSCGRSRRWWSGMRS